MNNNKKSIEIITNQKVYPWTTIDSVMVRGFAIYKDCLYQDDSFAQLFNSIDGRDSFESIVRELDGIFSVIVKIKSYVFVAVDHLRSLPLFYEKRQDGWVITDRLPISVIRSHSINERALKQFDHALEVLGNNTVCRDIYQVEAGELLVFDENENYPLRKKWWTYQYDQEMESDLRKTISIIDNGFNTSFKNLVHILDGRTAVIPLSGGHDSRLIAYYLKKYNYPKVLAYSYGKPNNQESSIAREVAHALGIPYFFIEYDRKGMRKWAKVDLESYLDFAGNGTSVPCVQEVYAVYYLKKNGIIPEDAVFVPGYSGDFLAGSHIPTDHGVERTNKKQLVQDILNKHFCENKKIRSRDREEISELVEYIFKDCPHEVSKEEYIELYERFDLMERQAKFIVNAVRAYEYYGYEWLLPEFDKVQFSTWMKVPLGCRKNRSVYFKHESAIYTDNMNSIKFADEDKKCDVDRFEEIRKILSKYSIFPWTRFAHPLYVFAPVIDYGINIYLKRNRSVNYWIYCKYKKMFT